MCVWGISQRWNHNMLHLQKNWASQQMQEQNNYVRQISQHGEGADHLGFKSVLLLNKMKADCDSMQRVAMQILLPDIPTSS